MASLQAQIQPRISQELKDRLDTECKSRRATQGMVIEAALTAFFEPDPHQETKLDTVLELLRGIQGQLDAIGKAQQVQLAGVMAPQTTPQAADLMSFYATLHGSRDEATESGDWTVQGDDEANIVHEPRVATKRRWWHRLLVKG